MNILLATTETFQPLNVDRLMLVELLKRMSLISQISVFQNIASNQYTVPNECPKKVAQFNFFKDKFSFSSQYFSVVPNPRRHLSYRRNIQTAFLQAITLFDVNEQDISHSER